MVKEYLLEEGGHKPGSRTRIPDIIDEIEINPEIARQMLKCQPEKKRRLNRILLLTLKKAITEGEDVCFIYPIIFNNWKLMDGIHRLQACADTNISFKTSIRFLYNKEYKRVFDSDRDLYTRELLEHLLNIPLMLKLTEKKMEKQWRILQKAMKEFLNRLPDDPLKDLWKTREWYKFDVIMGIWGSCVHFSDLRCVDINLLPASLDQKVSTIIGIIAHEFAHSFIGPQEVCVDDADAIIESHENNEDDADELVCEWGFAKEMEEARNAKDRTQLKK